MFKTISSFDLDMVTGGAGRGPAVMTWGQEGPGVRANLYSDGTLIFTGPKSKMVDLHGHPTMITRRGKTELQPKDPFKH